MIDRYERNKDIVQEIVESTATHVGRIATIITTAVADVAREVGDIVTDGFEMRDAARKARADEHREIVDAELVPRSTTRMPRRRRSPPSKSVTSTRSAAAEANCRQALRGLILYRVSPRVASMMRIRTGQTGCVHGDRNVGGPRRTRRSVVVFRMSTSARGVLCPHQPSSPFPTLSTSTPPDRLPDSSWCWRSSPSS